MIPHIWGIVLCASGSREDGCMGLDPRLCNMGWTEWFRPSFELVRLHKPRGVIIHNPGGLSDDGHQSGSIAPNLTLGYHSQSLAASMNRFYAAIDRMAAHTQVWIYLGTTFGDDDIGIEERQREYRTLRNAGAHGIIWDAVGAIQNGPESTAWKNVEAMQGTARFGVEPCCAPLWDRCLSLTLAGDRQQNGDLSGGIFDIDEIADTVTPHLPPEKHTSGERVVLDNADDLITALPEGKFAFTNKAIRRIKTLVRVGLSPCVPLWSFPYFPFSQGVRDESGIGHPETNQ